MKTKHRARSHASAEKQASKQASNQPDNVRLRVPCLALPAILPLLLLLLLLCVEHIPHILLQHHTDVWAYAHMRLANYSYSSYIRSVKNDDVRLLRSSAVFPM